MVNPTALSGKLAFLSLAELLQLLGSNNSEGVLSLTTKFSTEPAYIYFRNGNPIDAQHGDLQGLEAVFAVFGWTEGDFAFQQGPYEGEKTIKRSRMEIILDGLRMLDDGEIKRLDNVSFHADTPMPAGKKESAPLIKGPLVDYLYVVDEEEFFDGEDIIVEGNHGNWIWVILEGTVEISKSTPKGPLKLLRISDGAFIGSIGSFLADDSVRSVTARAIGNVQLGMLDSQGLSAEFHRMAPEFRAVVKSLDRRLKEITGSAMASYQGLNDSGRVLQDKRPVITETKNNDRGFLITGGRAIVARKLPSGLVPLVPLIKGDFIGQMPFLDMGLEPSSAIVLGEKNLKVAPINLAAMQKEYDQLSATFKNILENIATCILATSMVTCELEKKAASKTSG
jgi:hypothetical protein